MNIRVLYAAAHAEFPDTEPLGGGKAVADWLIREWHQRTPFELEVLSPRALGVALAKPLTDMGELEYARFCRQFELAATGAIRQHDPKSCIVLCNDISEGPDFATLGRLGYPVITIFHVDVVEFFTRFYLRNLVRPETLSAIRRFNLMPDVLRLVFEKQYQCVRHSERIIVPSAPMRDTIRRCYPWCAPEKIVVMPWGAIDHPSAEADGSTPDIDDDELVIMTMSRLSPEKGIERLLRALPYVNTNARRLRVFICGAPAYMRGRSYERSLKRLATGLNGSVCVEFPGHVTGARKAALLRRADIFVSPSRHESYGLAIAEASAAGCRVISHPHYGAAGTVVDCENSRALAGILNAMIESGRTIKPSPSDECPSQDSAAMRLADIIVEVAESIN